MFTPKDSQEEIKVDLPNRYKMIKQIFTINKGDRTISVTNINQLWKYIREIKGTDTVLKITGGQIETRVIPGTIFIEYNYDDGKFSLDTGSIKADPTILHVIKNDRSNDLVKDLPMNIQLKIDTTLIQSMIKANRGAKAGGTTFSLTSSGAETKAEATKILQEFHKANPLKSLKLSQIV